MKTIREIQAFSSNKCDELNYQKRYWFHKWIGNKTKALIETEEGKLIMAKANEFKFKYSVEEEFKVGKS